MIVGIIIISVAAIVIVVLAWKLHKKESSQEEVINKPSEPVSEWAVPPFYIYRRADMPLIRDCMNHGCGFDAPGNLAHYLVDVTAIHAWKMPGSRYDIGSLDSYEEAQKLFG